jgi:hypothetical protein
MTYDEMVDAQDADGERRMQRALDDEHERRVATGLAEARERWFREWAERGLAPLGLAHGMAFDAGWDAALRAAEEAHQYTPDPQWPGSGCTVCGRQRLPSHAWTAPTDAARKEAEGEH